MVLILLRQYNEGSFLRPHRVHWASHLQVLIDTRVGRLQQTRGKPLEGQRGEGIMGASESQPIGDVGFSGDVNTNMATMETDDESASSRWLNCCCVRKRCLPEPSPNSTKLPEEKALQICSFYEPLVDAQVFGEVIESVQRECQAKKEQQNQGDENPPEDAQE